jgi:hypothetical protein
VVRGLSLVGEELVEELGRTLHEHETTILGSVGGKVQKTLHGLHAAS